MNFQHAGIPTGMVFVPSVDGISHSPKEETATEAIREVAAVFTEAILTGPQSETRRPTIMGLIDGPSVASPRDAIRMFFYPN